jgi:hypothetical protein
MTVSVDGGYLHWPSGDVHLTSDAALRRRSGWRATADLARHRQHARFGDGASRQEDEGPTQHALAGVSARHVRRIEDGAFPKLSTLRALARAHGMGLDAYLSAVAEAAGRTLPLRR